MTTKILIIEDHPLMQMAIQTVLAGETDLELAPPVFNHASILSSLQELRPDLILFDLGLPNIDPISLVSSIRGVDPNVKILIYSGSTDPQLIARMLRETVNGYLTKNSSISELVTAIRSVLEGIPYLSGIATDALVKDVGDESKQKVKQLLEQLTPREREIFDLLIDRQDTNAIARQMGITASAVRSHTTHLMRKFGINNQKDLLLFAMKNDLMVSSAQTPPASGHQKR